MSAIVKQYGWPDTVRTDAEASQAAFLILQHSPIREFMKEMAPVLEAYYEAPDAPRTVPLVVISGGPGSDHRYMHAGRTFERLAEQRRVVMFDQRATGRSSPAPEEPTIEQWVADVEAVRRALDAERIDLLGHSFGGYLAMSYAVAHGDRVRKLVLVGSAAPQLSENVQLLGDIYPERIAEWQEQRASLADTFAAAEISVFFSMEFVDPSWTERYLEHVRGMTYDISVNNALRADMEARRLEEHIDEIETPVLVLHGRFDGVVAPSTSWSIHQDLTDSRFQVIEQSGHMPFIEQPDAFSAAVSDFLRE